MRQNFVLNRTHSPRKIYLLNHFTYAINGLIKYMGTILCNWWLHFQVKSYQNNVCSQLTLQERRERSNKYLLVYPLISRLIKKHMPILWKSMFWDLEIKKRTQIHRKTLMPQWFSKKTEHKKWPAWSCELSIRFVFPCLTHHVLYSLLVFFTGTIFLT